METIPWYQSAIIRQQIVQMLVAAAGLFGVAADVDWTPLVEGIFAGIAAVVAVWTVITRIRKPAPNMSQAAVDKERELVANGTIPKPAVTLRQSGRSTAMFLSALLALGITTVVMNACAGTSGAYRAAQQSDQSLPDTAYVIAEHYAAIVKEAADLAQSPSTPDAAKSAMQEADRHLKPIILGDAATGLPGLQTLVQRYQAVKDARTQTELQTAVNDAVRELANLINAVKAARRS